MLPRLTGLTLRARFYPPVLRRAIASGGGLTVQHDRQNGRFTVSPGGGAAAHECATLHYRFSGEKEVDLMSTFVPESFRGQGVAAVLSQAAMDFLVEENLKARVSCWYIKKYIDEHPHKNYQDRVIA